MVFSEFGVIKGMLNILFPKYCPGCRRVLDQPDIVLCLLCRNDLPLTHYHRDNNQSFVHKFYGRLPLVQGTALLHYHKKGLAQKLIHALKYRGQKDIGHWLGLWLGEELRVIPSYRGFSAVVPVPIHRKKLGLRGYNQAAIFAKALAQSLEIPCLETLLIQTEMRQTQAKQGRWERWSKKHGFALNPEYFSLANSVFSGVQARTSKIHEHITKQEGHSQKPSSEDNNMSLLLVDDVITTGATIEACGTILVHELGASLSCASIAIA